MTYSDNKKYLNGMCNEKYISLASSYTYTLQSLHGTKMYTSAT